MEQIFYAHVYSHLTYGLVICGSMLSKRNKNRISKIQMDCIHIINKRYAFLGNQTLCTSILSFADLINQELIKLGHNISNNKLPKPIIDLYITNVKTWHKYPTRRKIFQIFVLILIINTI